MPAVSGKQYRLMAGIAHGMKPLKSAGPSPAVAKEFIDATSKKKRKLWSKGG
jgi:hypothetical protein